MTDPCLLPEHLPLKLPVLDLLSLDEAFHVLDLGADLIEPLLVLDALLVEDSVIMLEVLVFLRLEGCLLLHVLDPVLQGGDGAAEVGAIQS